MQLTVEVQEADRERTAVVHTLIQTQLFSSLLSTGVALRPPPPLYHYHHHFIISSIESPTTSLLFEATTDVATTTTSPTVNIERCCDVAAAAGAFGRETADQLQATRWLTHSLWPVTVTVTALEIAALSSLRRQRWWHCPENYHSMQLNVVVAGVLPLRFIKMPANQIENQRRMTHQLD